MDGVTAGGIQPRVAAMEIPPTRRSTAWTSGRCAPRRSEVDRRSSAAASGPQFVEAITYRFVGHSRSDPGKYRPTGELEQWRERDPLVVAAARLTRAATASTTAGWRSTAEVDGRARGARAGGARGAVPRAGRRRRVRRPDLTILPADEPAATERRRGGGERLACRRSASGSARSAAERGLSLRELARRLDVSPSLVSQIETGKIQPSVRTLYAMVSELGVSLDEMFAPAEPTGRRRVDARLSAPAPGRAETPGDGGLVQRAGERSVIDLESGVRWERLTTRNDREVEFLLTVYAVGRRVEPGRTRSSATTAASSASCSAAR